MKKYRYRFGEDDYWTTVDNPWDVDLSYMFIGGVCIVECIEVDEEKEESAGE